jgi:hypothetical protein
MEQVGVLRLFEGEADVEEKDCNHPSERSRVGHGRELIRLDFYMWHENRVLPRFPARFVIA